MVLSGGHGGEVTARQLRDRVTDLTFCVSTFDRGGHSAQLRSRGHVALGDIRRVITALASDEAMKGVFGYLMNHRFSAKGSSSLNNWALGSLIIAGLEERYGCGKGIVKSLGTVCRLLEVKAKVLPISLDCAELKLNTSGIILPTQGVLSRRHIDAPDIMSGTLCPLSRIFPASEAAIRRAKLIVFAPGSLWDSVLVNLMVVGVQEAIHYAVKMGAKIVMITNLVMKENEVSIELNTTAHYVSLLCAHLGLEKIHAVLGNVGTFPPEILKRYAAERSHPVRFEETHEAELNIRGDFVSWDDNGVVHHNGTMADTLLGF